MKVAKNLAMLVALVLAVTGCDSKKKKKTTPEAAARRSSSVVVSSKGAKLAKCKKTPETRIVTLDLNRDKKRDRWILLDAANKKVCHELDTDYDGKPDISIRYFDDGITHAVIWWDLDHDGVWDQVMYNRPDGTKKRVEVRPYPTVKGAKASKKWKPLIWKHYRNIKGKGTVIERLEMDKDRNGYKDYWERYEDGQLREISWANPGDTDEKPKHWIEAPEEGKDKGFNAKDEPTKSKPKDKKAKARK